MDSVSEILRTGLTDLKHLYDKAKQRIDEDDSTAWGSLEKLNKSMADLAKKLRDQEVYERETISRQEFLQILGHCIEIFSEELVEHMGEDDEMVEIRNSILTNAGNRAGEIAGDAFTNDE